MRIPLKEVRMSAANMACGVASNFNVLKPSSGLSLTYDSELEVIVCERPGFATDMVPVHVVVKMTPVDWPVGVNARVSNIVDEEPRAGKLDQLRGAAIAIVEDKTVTDVHAIERCLDDELSAEYGGPVDETTRVLDAGVMQEAKERLLNEVIEAPVIIDEASNGRGVVINRPVAPIVEEEPESQDVSGGSFPGRTEEEDAQYEEVHPVGLVLPGPPKGASIDFHVELPSKKKKSKGRRGSR
jgi:hypothetical protein